MTHVKPPCGKVCPLRTVTCKRTCEKWKEYEEAKRVEYAQRDIEYHARMYSYTKEKAMSRYLVHKARRPELH